MDEIILRAAKEIGLGSHVSVEPFDGGEPLITVSFPPGTARRRIPVRFLLDEELSQLKVVLKDMVRIAQNG
jgi:hypothetical protein